MPEEEKLAAAVVAANGSTSCQESEEAQQHQRQHQQQGDPEEMELDEERPPPRPSRSFDNAGGAGSPDQVRAPEPFAAAAAAAGAVAAAARGCRGSEPTGTGNAADAADAASTRAAPASASVGGPERYSGRGFACPAQGAPQSCPPTAGEGARPTVTLWDAATSGVGVWGNGGGAGEGGGVGVISQEAIEVIEVGASVVDVSYPGGGDDGGGRWRGRLGQEGV